MVTGADAQQQQCPVCRAENDPFDIDCHFRESLTERSGTPSDVVRN